MGFISEQFVKMYKDAVLKRHDDTGTLFYFTIDDFPGLRREKYSFNTKKGHTLTGYFYSYGDINIDRLVVFDHGMGNGHRAYMREIERLCKSGFLVYSYDHTGCTESEGEYIMGLSGSLADLDSCINAMILKGFKTDKISVVGHSWGAFSTLNILGFYPNLKNIVALSGFISVKDMLKQFIPSIFASFRPGIYKMEAELNPEHYDRNAIKTLSEASSPALIVHSIDDNTVSSKYHYDQMRKALADKENITFLTLTGKIHNPNYTKDAVEYKEKFFKSYSRRIKKGIADMDAHKKFLASYDWHRMTAQDEEVWEAIIEFLNR